MAKQRDRIEFAQIEYHGSAGDTRASLNSIIRLIHFGDQINEAKLLTYDNEHCFLLHVNVCDCIAIKSGFSSGYKGTGPRGLSSALQLLLRHSADIEEYMVEEKNIRDIDDSCLRANDLENINSMRPVRPSRWYDYIFDDDIHGEYNNEKLRDNFPSTIPYAIIDTRIIDLALKFNEHPDNSIMSGYRRLEDIIRDRANLKDFSGSKLFSKAFQIENSILYWENVGSSECTGRASIFTGVYMAYRNNRAHRETNAVPAELLREFLLLNELFLLESKSVIRPQLKDVSDKSN